MSAMKVWALTVDRHHQPTRADLSFRGYAVVDATANRLEHIWYALVTRHRKCVAVLPSKGSNPALLPRMNAREPKGSVRAYRRQRRICVHTLRPLSEQQFS